MDEDRGDAERVAQELRAAADADADRGIAAEKRSSQFGEALKADRLRAGLSPEDLAERTHMPISVVYELQGKLPPESENIEKLATALAARGGAQAGSAEGPIPEQLENDAPHEMKVSGNGKPVWDVAGALAAIALVVAVFQVAKGLPGLLLSATCLTALILALAAGHRPVAWQRSIAKAGFFIFLVASVVLFVVTGSTDAQTSSSAVSSSTQPPTPTPLAPSSSSTTSRTIATPTSWEPAEPPRRYAIREGSSVSLFGGALVVGVTYVFDGWAALTLSTRGPECQPNLEPGRKALIADPDRNRWYEVRLTTLDGKQVTVSVEWGAGNRPSEPC
ncbi:helix-turn-helix transcriptional regulator [Kribbella sp. VKM Ac-2571]|uniref:helix-turn-helix domain-containing protein n=1 Tax=Kribbella sp. VKM Ac-2571 TaxID=2512222 RepID=UPI00105C0400|nr:helix-turn-helix transcriptional regulator [Kribbella sp. VKM Ac-2571]